MLAALFSWKMGGSRHYCFFGHPKRVADDDIKGEKGEWRFVRSYLYDPMWVGLPTQMATWNLKSSLLKTKNGLIKLHFGVSCLFPEVSSLEYNSHILRYGFIYIYVP